MTSIANAVVSPRLRRSKDARVLLLNVDYRPIKVISWERAIMLILEEKADLVQDYVGRLVRSAKMALPWPAVVRLREFVQLRGRIRFNRLNVLARDNFQCQFCGVKPTKKNGRPDLEDLTIDHVVPRAQSVDGFVVLPWSKKKVPITGWHNVTACCYMDNLRKGSRTPEQAGMTLRKIPGTPTPLDVLRMSLSRMKIPQEWQLYLPEAWRGDYWTVELDSN